MLISESIQAIKGTELTLSTLTFCASCWSHSFSLRLWNCQGKAKAHISNGPRQANLVTYRLCEQQRFRRACASLRISAVSPEPSLLAHTSSESRGTFRQKTRSLAPLNGWTCAVEICHDGMLEDTNSLDGAQIKPWQLVSLVWQVY